MSRSWLKALQIELRIASILHEQAQTGWLFDRNKCSDYIIELDTTMSGIYEELKPVLPISVKQYGVIISEPFNMDRSLKKMVTDWTDLEVKGSFTRVFYEDFNLSSDPQVKNFLLSLGWEPTLWNTRKKDTKNGKRGERTGPKLHERGELCENLANLDSNLGQKIVEYVTLAHRRGLLEGLLKVVRPDGRIPAEANTIGAATHRMTHRKVVNIPGTDAFYGKEIRSLFIAKEGYSIVGCDAKSCQARMLCHYMKDDAYSAKVVESDIHIVNKELVGLASKSEAKTVYYAFLFGAGDAKVGKSLGGNAKAGKAAKDKFLIAIPNLGPLLEAAKKSVRVRGYLYGLDGRKVYCSSEHKALNYLLQSAEAIYMKYSQAILDKAIKKEGLDANFIATVHDEYQLEVKDEDVDRVSELCLWAMKKAGEYLNISVPMEGDVNVGKDWSETH